MFPLVVVEFKVKHWTGFILLSNQLVGGSHRDQCMVGRSKCSFNVIHYSGINQRNAVCCVYSHSIAHSTIRSSLSENWNSRQTLQQESWSLIQSKMINNSTIQASQSTIITTWGVGESEASSRRWVNKRNDPLLSPNWTASALTCQDVSHELLCLCVFLYWTNRSLTEFQSSPFPRSSFLNYHRWHFSLLLLTLLLPVLLFEFLDTPICFLVCHSVAGFVVFKIDKAR